MLPLILKLPWPPTANLIWRNSRRGGGTYLSAEYRAFLLDAQKDYLLQGRPRAPEGMLFQVTIRLHAPDFRGYDVDNRIKPTLDALTKIGVWQDDRCARKVSAVESFPVSGGGAALVVIEPFEPEGDEFCDLLPIRRKGRKKKNA